MTKLYEMSKDYLALLDDEIEKEQLDDLLECVGDEFNDKAVNIIKVTKILDSDVTAIDSEIKRLQAKKKAIVNNQNRLKEYLRYNMEVTGINKIEHPLFKITLGKPTKKVNIIDVDQLDDEYVNVVTEIKPDLNKIKKALKDGSVAGAELVDSKSRLLIK